MWSDVPRIQWGQTLPHRELHHVCAFSPSLAVIHTGDHVFDTHFLKVSPSPMLLMTVLTTT